ncbi:MAG: protein kinase, partial [Thermoguttaceae bacterium]|nr:protein kinase [Thermoguttaceae bacterium]
MNGITVEDLKQRLLTLDLLDMGKIRDVENSFGPRLFSAEEFLQASQRRGYLTKYQAERLLAGEATGFYYGDYRVQYLVGSGSFARVFRCVHKDSGKVVAVKVLRARFRDDQTTIDEFVREAELGHELRHPNIAAVYDWTNPKKNAKTRSGYYMVMDFIEGRTLREELKAQRNGRVEPKRAARIVTDVAAALDYASRRGYQHRDMKLSNIMLSSSGKAFLLDFGLLADENSDTKTQRAIEYAALERMTHVRRDDKRSDVYFLGAIFYQLLSGIAPLGEIKERAKRLDATRFRNVKPLREVAPFVPKVLAFIVNKAMQLDPEERYQSAGAMHADLELAVQKLDAGELDAEIDARAAASLAQADKKKERQPAVMIVEANPDWQNMFRKSFKDAGFRALIISSPLRALERLDEPSADVEAVLINAQWIGVPAVEAFNKLATTKATQDIPAILLLAEDQTKWAAKTKRGPKRYVIGMPVTMKRLLLAVKKLTDPEPVAPPKAPAAPSGADFPGASKSSATIPAAAQAASLIDDVMSE